MRLHLICMLLLAAVTTTVNGAASTNLTFVAEEIAQISVCGVACLTETIPEAGCGLADIQCQCSSSELFGKTSDCMLANCTLAETLQLSKIQAAVCERPYESQNQQIRIMTIVTTVIGNTLVAARIVSRLCLHHTLALDDWFIIAAAISDGLFSYYGFQIEYYGFGEHVWSIDLAYVPQLLHWFYICEILYVLTIGLVKVSILMFYLRVFPVRSLHLATWTMIAYCVASTTAFALVTVFQCQPIDHTWNKDINGQCINYNAVAWANAAINIQQDILILLLPINALRRLQLNLKKKIGMYAMFGVGGFVCIASMVRLNSLHSFGLTVDPTWDNVPTTFWSTLEATTAIFCACMPSIRAGLVSLFPNGLGTDTRPPTLPQSHFRSNALNFTSSISTKGNRRRDLGSLSSTPDIEDDSRSSESELIAMSARGSAIASDPEPYMAQILHYGKSLEVEKPLPSLPLPSLPDLGHDR